jgi:hypothetical protein
VTARPLRCEPALRAGRAARDTVRSGCRLSPAPPANRQPASMTLTHCFYALGGRTITQVAVALLSRLSRRSAFDTLTSKTHSKSVRLILRRLAAVVCLLAFAESAWAQCAGWQTTPEARRQCCESGVCPLHHREGSSSRTRVTQAAADDCCAQPQQRESSPSGTVFGLTMMLAVAQSLPPFVPALAPPTPFSAPSAAPSPPAHVPKHVLLSVFLV